MAKPKPNLDWLGQTIGGRYVIEDFIDQGGMSTVYKASDPNLKRTVAIKLIHTHLSRDPEFVRRFEQEATAVAQLRHANIVQVYDFSHEDDLYYMVMEYVPGDTLKGRLKSLHDRNQQLSVAETIRIMAFVCDAVAYAHEHDMIHRDIKPANVILTSKEQPILMDFGVAKMLTGTDHTATGTIIGTAKYMSPEQARGDRPDERSDIYALGVMLYEMLAGHPPFEADTTVAILMKHVNEPVPDIRQIQHDVPDELVEIIDKALAKNRNDRYQSAAHMAAALKLINRLGQSPASPADAQKTVTSKGRQSTEPSGVKSPLPTGPAVPTAPGPTAKPTATMNRNLWLIGAAALVLIIILGVGAFFVISALTGSSDDEGDQSVAVIEEETTGVPEEEAQIPVEEESQAPTTTEEEVQQVSAEELNLPSAIGMVKVDSGLYTVGRDAPGQDYVAPNQVELTEVWIDQYEVTNAEYAAFLADTDNQPPTSWSDGNMPGGQENHPVKGVTWDLATAYCEWTNKRLPTEAEWEVAARGSEGSLFPWGDDQRAVELPRRGTHIVGTVPGNRSSFGTFDMAGNVWEWVGEAYAPIADGHRILRGGENGFLKDMAYRLSGPADQESLIQSAGFRCGADQVRVIEAAILFEDEFTDPATGWPDQDIEGEPYRIGYHPPDYYHLEPREAETSIVATQGEDFTDISVESEVFVDHTDTDTGEYRYGLVVRRVSDDEYYAFTVSPRSGTWAAVKSTASGMEELAAGQVDTLQGFAPVGFVPEQTDILRVNASGSNFEFYVNGESVARVRDGDYGSGEVGFYAETFDETLTHVHYEALAIRQAEAPVQARLLFEDEFTDPATGWPDQDIESEPYRIGYHPPDYYHLEPREAETSIVSTQGQDFVNVSVESQVFVDHTDTDTGEYRYGLVVRRVSDDEYYAFTVSPRSGTWVVLKSTASGLEELIAGEVDTLQGFAPAGFVPETADVLQVDAGGSSFVFYINGEVVAQVRDGDYGSGEVGFYAETFDETLAHIHYESMSIREFEVPPVQILLEDEFTDPATGWPEEDIEGEPYRIGYHPPDYYHLEPREAETSIVATQERDFTNVSVESQVFVDHTDTESGGYRYGLVVRRMSEDEYYAFTVSPRSGTWAAVKSTPSGLEELSRGTVESLQGFAPAGFVPESADTLRVDANGSNFEFYVNGDLLAQISDGAYASGEVGFYAETFTETLSHIHYESVIVREPESLAISLSQ